MAVLDNGEAAATLRAVRLARTRRLLQFLLALIPGFSACGPGYPEGAAGTYPMIHDLVNAIVRVITWPFRALARVIQALFGA